MTYLHTQIRCHSSYVLKSHGWTSFPSAHCQYAEWPNVTSVWSLLPSSAMMRQRRFQGYLDSDSARCYMVTVVLAHTPRGATSQPASIVLGPTTLSLDGR